MVEAIHLKNGSVIKGVIIEQIPDKQITIRTSDGSTFVYPMEDISKITKEEKESKIPFKISNEKYDLTGSRFMIDLGYWAGGYKGPELYFTYGSQINQYLFVGGGTGIHYMTDYSTVSIPIFADVRGYALNGPISPFIALRIGYKFNTKEAPRHAKKGGLYCNPFIGVRFMTTKKQAVNLGIGYSIQKVSFDEEMLAGRICYGGLDLSSTTDITAFVLVFPPTEDDEHYYVLPYFWLPEETLPLRVRRDHVPYDVWERQGYLKTTEGNVVHYGFIENFIDELGQKFHIKEIAFDRWGAVQMSQNLEGLGFTMVQFGQGYKDMSPPTKELMKLTLEQTIAHNGHPVLRWMMDNIFIRRDPAGNIKPDKEKSTEKIDGAVAMIMALDRAIRCGCVSDESVYDMREMLVF